MMTKAYSDNNGDLASCLKRIRGWQHISLGRELDTRSCMYNTRSNPNYLPKEKERERDRDNGEAIRLTEPGSLLYPGGGRAKDEKK